MTSPLSERTRRILAALIREYIDTGEPVSSSSLTAKAGLGVSSATIRNVLSQLEEMGYLWQPHTSAGRVPTDLGYRFYVDLLLDARRRSKDTSAVEARLRQEAGAAPLIDHLLSTASHVLSEASHHVGFAVSPSNGEAIFDRIEFVPLSTTRILVVVVARGNQMYQKPVEMSEPVSSSELVRAANYLNAEFAGVPLNTVREAVLERLREERSLCDELLGLSLRLAMRSLENLETPSAVCIDGASALLEQVVGPSGLPLGTRRALLRMVE